MLWCCSSDLAGRIPGQFSKLESRSGSFLRGVPHYFGDRKGDPYLENCPPGASACLRKAWS